MEHGKATTHGNSQADFHAAKSSLHCPDEGWQRRWHGWLQLSQYMCKAKWS